MKVDLHGAGDFATLSSGVLEELRLHGNSVECKEVLFLTKDEIDTSVWNDADNPHLLVVDLSRSTAAIRELEKFCSECSTIARCLLQVDSGISFLKLVHLLLTQHYPYEILWSMDFSLDLIIPAHAEGFLVMGLNVPFLFKSADMTFDMLLCKIHHERCLIDLSKGWKVSRSLKRQSVNWSFSIDLAFSLTIKKITEYHASQNWVHGALQSLWRRWHENEVFVIEEKWPTIHSIEIWDDDELIASEIGVVSGSIFTSMTGWHSLSGSGNAQMYCLRRVLRDAGFTHWDLGMMMDYKSGIGGVGYQRREFVHIFQEAKLKPAIHKFAEQRVREKVRCSSLLNE